MWHNFEFDICLLFFGGGNVRDQGIGNWCFSGFSQLWSFFCCATSTGLTFNQNLPKNPRNQPSYSQMMIRVSFITETKRMGPSRELTAMPSQKYVWRWFSFSQLGIWIRSQEGWELRWSMKPLRSVSQNPFSKQFPFGTFGWSECPSWIWRSWSCHHESHHARYGLEIGLSNAGRWTLGIWTNYHKNHGISKLVVWRSKTHPAIHSQTCKAAFHHWDFRIFVYLEDHPRTDVRVSV